MEVPRGTMIGVSVAGSDGSPVISMPSLKSKWMDSPCQSITQVNINHSGPSVIVNWKYWICQIESFESFPQVNQAIHSEWLGLVDSLGNDKVYPD